MRLAAVGLVLALCPASLAADPAKPVFAVSSVQDGLGGRIELRADRRWSTQSHAGRGDRGRLSRRAMKQFRALLAAAPFAIVVDKACSAVDKEIVLVDFERDRFLKLEPPCVVADEATERISHCLATLMYGGDPSDVCRVP